MSEFIFDIQGSEAFDQLVLENSSHKPVLVDFWADWCAPCKALMPVLEKITEQYQGELLLAKVNCDVEQEIVMRFGVRSLPTVVLFKDGRPVDGFSGAQPEAEILQMLEKHLPVPVPATASPLEQAREFFAQNSFAQAEELLKQSLSQDNSQAEALILYARCLLERNELAEATQVLAAITTDEYKQELAAARAQLEFLQQATEMPDMAELKSQLAQNPSNDLACYQLAVQQLARQQYEPALQSLLELFSRNASFQDGAAKHTLLQVFDLLGNDNQLVTSYRRKLYQLLY